MTLEDKYVIISALIYALIITCFLVHSLITKKQLSQEEAFTHIGLIVISPILGMFISVLIFPAIVIGILWLISKGIYSLKKQTTMKTILFALTLMLLASCTTKESTLQVCHTGEKVVMFNDVYTVGDTVILQQVVDPLGELAFEIDNNWIAFNGNVRYLESEGYYKAVVIQ